MSSRNRYHTGRVLFPSDPSADPIPPPTDTAGGSDVIGTTNQGSNVLGKREIVSGEQLPSAKKQTSSTCYKVGDKVCVHTDRLDKHHVPCRVVLVVGKRYQLYCHKGVLNRSYVMQELSTCKSDWSLSLEGWRTGAKVSLQDVASDPNCLEKCECAVDKVSNTVIDLTQDDDSDAVAASSKNWLCNPLYTLTSTNREEVLSPSSWLSDSY